MPLTTAHERRNAAALACAVLLISLGLTFQAWRSMRESDLREAETELELRARDVESLVRQRMLAYEQVLRGGRGLFAASDEVTRDDFRTYVAAQQLWESYPGIQGVGFSRLVPAAQLDAHLAQLRREAPAYRLWPEGPRDPYTSIVFLEPFEGRNLRAFGYDMFSEPVRRAAMERARDTGHAALSGRVTLVQETAENVQVGTLLYLPVYENGTPDSTLEQRRASLVGWVYAPFRMRDLMVGVLGPRAQDIRVALFDGERTTPQALLFDSDAELGPLRTEGAVVRALDVAGERWTMVVQAAEQYAAASPRPRLVAISGLSASIALALLVWTLGATRARALERERAAREDLSRRQRAAVALAAAHRFAQSTLDAFPAQVCVLDEAGTILSINRAWRAFGAAHGVSVAEGASYVAESERAAARGDVAARRFLEALRELLAGRRHEFSLEFAGAAGSPRAPTLAPVGGEGDRWVTIHATRFDDDGRVRVLLAHADVTEQHRAEEQTRVAEQRLRLAATAARQVEWDCDALTRRTTFGDLWSEITEQAASPHTIEELAATFSAADRDQVRARLDDCVEGRAERVEFDARLDGAHPRWVRVSGAITARTPDGAVSRVSGTLGDVDEVHALQDQLVATSRLASVGTLAAGVAHEINNPLAWVHSNLALGLELLGEGPVDPKELATLLAEALEGSERIATIVKAMRALGRPERAEAPRAVDIRGELHQAIQMVRNELQQRARLELDVPETLPRVTARAGELGRVFLNLLMNAVQAIEQGHPERNRVRCVVRVWTGEVEVAISDSGPGIAPDAMSRLFDPFFTTKPVGQGTGLGLSIARNIVDSTGGTLTVESVVGEGATFRVRLPTTGEARVAPTPPRADRRRRRRVLVVDDEPLVAQSLARWLERSHEVTTLSSADEALRRLDEGERWDALLIDLMMPGTDGVAVYEALEARHPGLVPHLAFVTGGAFGARATGFLETHEVIVLPKPVDEAQLLDTVERLSSR